MVSASSIVAAILAAVALASPTPSPRSTQLFARAEPLASEVLQTVLNTTTNCANPPAKANCATNVQAAPPLIEAMLKYNIYNVYEISAIVGTIAYETVNFVYDINVSPGRAGQGTRNMQEAPFNLLYAQSIPELKAPLAAITTATTVDGLSDTELNAIRALVLPDQYSWASGAWFYSTQCSSSVKSSLQTGTLAGFNAYLGCVGVQDTPAGDRKAKFQLGVKGFGLPQPT